MTPTEHRELDAWIHKHVLKADLYVGLKKRGLWYRTKAQGYTDRQSEAGRFTRAEAKKHEYLHDEPVTIHEFEPAYYSTDPAAAMEVLKRCMETVKEKFGHSIILTDSSRGFCVGINIPSQKPEIADTLELSIAKFAKRLFTK